MTPDEDCVESACVFNCSLCVLCVSIFLWSCSISKVILTLQVYLQGNLTLHIIIVFNSGSFTFKMFIYKVIELFKFIFKGI